MKLRTGLQEFFNKHEIAWEIFMVALALVFVAIGFIPDFVELSVNEFIILDSVDWAITIFFALEFILRFLIAVSRKNYFNEHWLDIVAILPWVRWLRIARLARVFRLLRLVRLIKVLNSIDRFNVSFERFARLNGLQWIMLALTSIMIISSILLFFFENPVNDKIQTYWDALYASLITWTTPGYGEIVPMTVNGRICGLVLIVSGLVTWGMLIANLASYLSIRKNGKECDSDPAITELQQKLAKLEQLSTNELVALRGAIDHLVEHQLRQLHEKQP